MHAEEVSKEEREILNELLVFGIAGIVGRLEVKRERDNLGNSSENFCKHLDQLLIVSVVLTSLKAANLRQALQSHVSEFGHF